MKKSFPVDSTGRKIRKGDVVRIIGLPSFSRLDQRELKAVFKFLLGTYRIVRSFDKYGDLEISFQVRRKISNIERGFHTVVIEPHLTRLRRRRDHGHRQ